MIFRVILAFLDKAAAVRTGELPVGTPVRVYRNLHNGKLSVQVKQDGKWRVHAHVDDLTLDNAKFLVNQAGRERTVREKAKNVHAFFTGTVAEHDDLKGAQRIEYNPYQMSQFRRADNQEHVFESPKARIKSTGAMYAIL